MSLFQQHFSGSPSLQDSQKKHKATAVQQISPENLAAWAVSQAIPSGNSVRQRAVSGGLLLLVLVGFYDICGSKALWVFVCFCSYRSVENGL